MNIIKVFRSSAFVELAQEIKRFGAMLEQEAETRFSPELVAQAIRQRVCTVRQTPLGNILYLLHFGRKLAGVTGAFTPTDDALMNAVCLRDIGLRLEQAGYEIDLEYRKRSLVFATAKKRVLVLAQHNGYSHEALRRLNKKFIVDGDFDQVQLFTYLAPSELKALKQLLYQPARRSPPIDSTHFLLLAVKPPTGKGTPKLPAEVIN